MLNPILIISLVFLSYVFQFSNINQSGCDLFLGYAQAHFCITQLSLNSCMFQGFLFHNYLGDN